MDIKLQEFLLTLASYRALFGILAVLFLLVAASMLITSALGKLKLFLKKKQTEHELDKKTIRNLDYTKVKDEYRTQMMRSVVAPDAIDPGPNGYLVLDDCGKEVYVRTLTIDSTPKTCVFAETFAVLMDFPGCESNIFIKPISEAALNRKMDRQITVLASEFYSAEGDPNRTRKIKEQYRDTYQWAEDLESGDTRFFDVGFLFTFSATSLAELNKITDNFRSKALSRNITVTNCYSVQAEAFAMSAPFNDTIKVGSKYIPTNGINYLFLDKFSLSTVFNYTQNSFSHKEGVILGRDMNSGTPIIYNYFDPSHDGFTIVIAGKTGSGKSATIKMYCCRSIPLDYRYVCIDSQIRKGTNEAEFAALAELVNGVNLKISNDSEQIMNPFEIGETTKTVKVSSTAVREIRTLELNDKITMAVHTLSTMLQGSKEISSLENMIPINRILTDVVSELYQDYGLVDGDPDSLYTAGNVVSAGGNGVGIGIGRVKKTLPTITDYYKKLLIKAAANKDEALTMHYNLILMGHKDFVRELYYTSKTLKFLTKEDFMTLRLRDSKGNNRVYRNTDGMEEDVVVIKGTRAYFDGQSTFEVSVDCPFTNIDISHLPEKEKQLARQIAMDFVNEMFIKKNSESINAAKKLVCIFDECHENFVLEYARKTLDNVVRTARKRHVAVVISTQTLSEFKRFDETEAILKQATAKFVFKQDPSDKDWLVATQNLTESQAAYIVNSLGGDEANEEDRERHRGEVCIIDNKNVVFCKVDYLKDTEALAVETNATEVEKLMEIVA